MDMFVNKTRVPISEEVWNPETKKMQTNTIYIKPKMGFGSKQRVLGATTDVRGLQSGKQDVSVDIGKGNIQLLVENIIGWEGPAFEVKEGKHKGQLTPCNPYTIQELDPDQPLVMKALEEINQRNAAKKPIVAEPVDEVGDGEDAEFRKPELEEALSPN